MSKIQRLRDQLYLLQGSRCFYCDRGIPADERSLEHVVPSSEGGLADADNGVVVCEAANQLLGTATPKQKMIMLKAGGGKIECPKKCMTGHPHGHALADENHPKAVAQRVSQEPQKASAPKDAAGQPMTAKQKHKARSGHQSMPRPASGGRRR